MTAYFAQNMLVFPAHSAQGTASTRIESQSGVELLRLKTESGITIAAVFTAAQLPDGTPDPAARHRPTILYFYGNGGSVAWSTHELDEFRRLGANVLIPDFAGYGMSGGLPSERALNETADAAYDHLSNRKDIDPHLIIAFGWSLGGAVAIDLAHRRPVAGLAVFNAFTTLPDVARHTFAWLPTRWLLRYTFDNRQKIMSCTCPTFICSGAKDTLIPSPMADELSSRAGGQVTQLVLPDASHNSIFRVNSDVLRPALKTFIAQCESARPQRPEHDQKATTADHEK